MLSKPDGTFIKLLVLFEQVAEKFKFHKGFRG